MISLSILLAESNNQGKGCAFRLEPGVDYKSRNLIYEEPDHKLVVYLEMAGGVKFDWCGNETRFNEWTVPPGESIDDAKRAEILSRLADWCKKEGVRISIGPPMEREKMFADYANAGYRVTRRPDGTTVVERHPYNNLFINIVHYFKKALGF